MISKHLPRRTVLRGLGTAVALPLLEAMVPALSFARRTEASARRRLAVFYVPNGIVMEDWTPKSEGADYELPAILQPVRAYRDDFLLLSGLTQNNGRALQDGPGDHARAAASYLTGVHPKKTDGADIRNGISFDQIAAEAVGGKMRFRSLELGCEQTGLVGNCDSGYSCAYTNNLAWKSETTPLPPEVNPRLVFERLFGAGEDAADPASRARRRQQDGSILDLVQEEARSLTGSLGPADRRKLDEYLSALREIEKRLEETERTREPAADLASGIEKPSGIPVDFQEHIRLMLDMIVIAFQADLTPVATLMAGREGSKRTYREIGVPEAHHGLTHHKGDPEKIRQVARINTFHVEQLAYFFGKLKSVRDGDGTLLDHSMILYGSGLSDGDRHDHHDLPVLLAGKGGGALHPGRHVRYPVETPMTNLYLTVLDRMGVRPESVGDSTGRLEHLSGI